VLFRIFMLETPLHQHTEAEYFTATILRFQLLRWQVNSSLTLPSNYPLGLPL